MLVERFELSTGELIGAEPIDPIARAGLIAVLVLVDVELIPLARVADALGQDAHRTHRDVPTEPVGRSLIDRERASFAFATRNRAIEFDHPENGYQLVRSNHRLRDTAETKRRF